MRRNILTFCVVMLAALPSFSQTSSISITPGALVDSADFFLQKGLLEKQNGRRLESLKNFEKAARYDANSKAITTELASAYQDLRRYNLAREMYKKLVTMGEENAAIYKQLLNLSFQMKQNEDVLLYADKLKTADPSEKVLYYVGRVHYDMDNYGDAIKYLTGAQKEDPANAEIPYLIAHSYSDMMNYKLAVPYFKKAIEMKPTESYWVYELGLICYAMHDDKNALKYILEAGDKGYKKDNDYLENLSIAYLNVGELDKGVEMLNEILKRKPSDLNILGMVAEAYYAKGKFDLAMEYYDRMLEYDKDNASSLYMIGMCYQKKGGKENMEKGTRLCDKAIEMDPSLANLKQKKMMAGL
ncbi:MAG TPA: tetratricopeptide repeat protein [Chitinophagaceae bacterium]|nr:tetratricopeptide repeat protein [Chitinophagaceae bacterium]